RRPPGTTCAPPTTTGWPVGKPSACRISSWATTRPCTSGRSTESSREPLAFAGRSSDDAAPDDAAPDDAAPDDAAPDDDAPDDDAPDDAASDDAGAPRSSTYVALDHRDRTFRLRSASFFGH